MELWWNTFNADNDGHVKRDANTPPFTKLQVGYMAGFYFICKGFWNKGLALWWDYRKQY